MQGKFRRVYEIARDVGAFAALPIIIPAGIAVALIEDEIINRLTGKRKRKEIENARIKKRCDEERGRIDARRKAYVNWTMAITPIIQENYFGTREQIENHVGAEPIPQRWGGSFWDYGYRELRAVPRADGTYQIAQFVPESNEPEKVYDNQDQGYNLEQIGNRFASQIAENIRHRDIPSREDQIGQSYRDIRKNIKKTARSAFIKEFKEKTGIDLRKAVKENKK